MTTVYHPNVNTVVPWQANYTYPSQATQIHKQTVKIQPMGSQSITGATGTKITFQMPSDGYLNTRNSAFSFNVRISGVKMAHATLRVKVVDSAVTPTFANWFGTAQGITDGNFSTNDFFNEPEKWYVICLDGVNAGFVGQISDYVGANQSIVFEAAVNGSPATPLNIGDSRCIIVNKLVKLASAGVHSLFKRVVIRYGGLVLEDIQEYAKLAQLLLTSGAAPSWASGAGALCDGVTDGGASPLTQDHMLAYATHGLDYVSAHALAHLWVPGGTPSAPYIERKFTFNLFAGLTTAQKLLPLKWMAAQFRIELELAPFAEAFIQYSYTMTNGNAVYSANASNQLTYSIEQPVYIAELMEFDSLYDTAFYAGMQQMGVPIKFTSWHHQRRSVPGDGTQHFPLSENARSMKAAFAVLTDVSAHPSAEFLNFYHNVGIVRDAVTGKIAAGTVTNPVREFQWRIGGRYSPAQPVDCTAGGSEAFLELSKAINSLGDYTFSQRIRPLEWSSDLFGQRENGQRFIMAQEFENTDVFPNTISGINAENQSDLMLKITFSGTGYTAGSKNLETFISFDNLLILREGHLVDLVM